MKNKICLFTALALLIMCLSVTVGCAERKPIETPIFDSTTSTAIQTTVNDEIATTLSDVVTTATTATATTATTKLPYETMPALPETRIDQTVYEQQTTQTDRPPIKYTMNPPPVRELPALPEIPSVPDIDMKVSVQEGNGGANAGYLFSVGKVESINADGTMTVTLAGTKIENAQRLNWTFIYLDFDGNIRRAGDSTKVTLKTTADIIAPVVKAIGEYKKAYDDFNTTVEFEMSEAVKTEYFVKAMDAYDAYEQAKEKAKADFLDGQFWGVENSAVYRYINGYRYTYQKEPDDVTFYFILKDGEYCVLVNTFFKA